MENLHPIPDSYRVAEGFFAGPRPNHEDRAVRKEWLQALLVAGVRTVIDLTTPAEPAGCQVFIQRMDPDVAWFNAPIANGTVPGRVVMQSILDLIDLSLAKQRPVYLHCLGGLGRTGTVVACWLIRHGLEQPDGVIERLRRLREGQPHGHRPSPETGVQLRFFKAWQPGW